MDILSKFAPESLVVIIWKEFLARASAGNYAYLPAWIAVCIYGKVYQQAPVFCIINTIAFVLIAAYRASFIKHAHAVEVEKIKATQKVVSFMILFSALHWSLTVTYLLNSHVEYALEFKYFLITLLATFASGGASTYNAFGKLGIWFSLCTISIPFLVEFIKDPSNGFFYVVIAFVFLAIASKISSAVQNYAIATNNHFKLLGMYAKTMEELSKLDFLTKLKSRYQFLIDFEVAWHDAIKQKTPIALLYMHLDNLNTLNEQYGHQCRDACLVAFAELLQKKFKAPSVIARYGSEEIMLATPHQDINAAHNTAEEILKAVRSLPFEYQGAQIPLTCSIGVVNTHPEIISDPEFFIKSADTQLLLAKNSGKDCFKSDYINT